MNESKTGSNYSKFLCYNQGMYLAVDIGGTKTLIALFSKRGRVIRRFKFKTARKFNKFLGDLEVALAEFKKYKITTITVAIPGLVQKNYSVSLGNRDWDKIDLYTPIKSLFGCPVYFENDANLATLYESSFYTGRVVFLTFSTGIGGGVAEKGKLLSESSKFEPGHKIYTYNEKKAEWEDIAAASALEKYYHVDYATDLRKKAIMMDVANRITLGLPSIIGKYHPDVVIIGGPMGKIFKRFYKYMPELGVEYKRPKRPLESVIYGCYLFSKNKN